MRRSTVMASGAIALISLGLAACSSGSSGSGGASTTSSGKAPFTILAIVASSGALAAVTQAEISGMKVAAKYVNAHGGISGHQVKISVENDNLDPTTAASLLQKAVSSGGTPPDLVYAGTTSTEALAMMPILTQDKIFSLQVDVTSQTIDPATHPYAFSLATSSEDFALEVAATTKAHYPTAKKIGMIIGNDVNGQSLLQGEKPAFEKEGYSVSVEQYNPTTTINMVPQLEALRATNPQVLLASGFGAAAGYILKARSQLGWNIPVVGDASFSSNPLTSIASASALKSVNILSATPEVYRPLSSQSAAFKTLYKAVAPANGAFVVSFDLYEFGWDEIMVAQAAAKQAGSFGTASMTQAMEHLKDTDNPMYLLGTYQYSATSHTPVRSLSTATLASPYTKDGQSLPFGQS